MHIHTPHTDLFIWLDVYYPHFFISKQKTKHLFLNCIFCRVAIVYTTLCEKKNLLCMQCHKNYHFTEKNVILGQNCNFLSKKIVIYTQYLSFLTHKYPFLKSQIVIFKSKIVIFQLHFGDTTVILIIY